jgi:hypothetical protein
MSAKRKKQPVLTKHSQRYYLEHPGEPPLLSEYWTKDETGSVISYGLAYIDFAIHSGDNGRVLGYDNGHKFHERHYMGVAKPVDFISYEDQAARFFEEVDRIRKRRMHV